MSLHDDALWKRFDLKGECTSERKARADRIQAGGGITVAVYCQKLNHTLIKSFDNQTTVSDLKKDFTLSFVEFDKKINKAEFLTKAKMSYFSLRDNQLLPVGPVWVESLAYVISRFTSDIRKIANLKTTQKKNRYLRDSVDGFVYLIADIEPSYG